MHERFRDWLKSRDAYITLVFKYGDRLWDRDGDTYRCLPVQLAFEAYQEVPN